MPQGFCPCEDRCTNQVFSKKQFAKLDVVRAWARMAVCRGRGDVQHERETLYLLPVHFSLTPPHACMHAPAQKRAGAKGFGLFAAEPIRAGQFIIEYVGEVLEEDEYLRRKDFYQEVGMRQPDVLPVQMYRYTDVQVV